MSMHGKQWRLRRAGTQRARNDRSKAHFVSSDNASRRTTRVHNSGRRQDRPGHARPLQLSTIRATGLRLAARVTVRRRPSTDDRHPLLPRPCRIRRSLPMSIEHLPRVGVAQLARKVSHASKLSTPPAIRGSCCRGRMASGCWPFNPARRPRTMTSSSRPYASCLPSAAWAPWTS